MRGIVIWSFRLVWGPVLLIFVVRVVLAECAVGWVCVPISLRDFRELGTRISLLFVLANQLALVH